MPTLKDLRCSIELSDTKSSLQEHSTVYGDGYVETYIAAPTRRTAFTVHLSSQAFIAEGLAMYVYIDGEYQCNRNRRGLVDRSNRTERLGSKSLIDFRVRQKEERQGSGELVATPWCFEDGKVVSPRTPPGAREEAYCIEVIVIRCRGDRNMQAACGGANNSLAGGAFDGGNDMQGEFFGRRRDGYYDDRGVPDRRHASRNERPPPPVRRTRPTGPKLDDDESWNSYQGRRSPGLLRAGSIEPPGYSYGVGPVPRNRAHQTEADSFAAKTSRDVPASNIVDPAWLHRITQEAYQRGIDEATRKTETNQQHKPERRQEVPGAWPDFDEQNDDAGKQRVPGAQEVQDRWNTTNISVPQQPKQHLETSRSMSWGLPSIGRVVGSWTSSSWGTSEDSASIQPEYDKTRTSDQAQPILTSPRTRNGRKVAWVADEERRIPVPEPFARSQAHSPRSGHSKADRPSDNKTSWLDKSYPPSSNSDSDSTVTCPYEYSSRARSRQLSRRPISSSRDSAKEQSHRIQDHAWSIESSSDTARSRKEAGAGFTKTPPRAISSESSSDWGSHRAEPVLPEGHKSDDILGKNEAMWPKTPGSRLRDLTGLYEDDKIRGNARRSSKHISSSRKMGGIKGWKSPGRTGTREHWVDEQEDDLIPPDDPYYFSDFAKLLRSERVGSPPAQKKSNREKKNSQSRDRHCHSSQRIIDARPQGGCQSSPPQTPEFLRLGRYFPPVQEYSNHSPRNIKPSGSYEYTHAVGRPEYIDNFDQPYAIFRFKYANRGHLQKILRDEVPDEEPVPRYQLRETPVVAKERPGRLDGQRRDENILQLSGKTRTDKKDGKHRTWRIGRKKDPRLSGLIWDVFMP